MTCMRVHACLLIAVLAWAFSLSNLSVNLVRQQFKCRKVFSVRIVQDIVGSEDTAKFA